MHVKHVLAGWTTVHAYSSGELYKKANYSKKVKMAATKTREKLVDVARQLFAKQGLEDTTMNDIAVASGKGRRTLYT